MPVQAKRPLESYANITSALLTHTHKPFSLLDKQEQARVAVWAGEQLDIKREKLRILAEEQRLELLRDLYKQPAPKLDTDEEESSILDATAMPKLKFRIFRDGNEPIPGVLYSLVPLNKIEALYWQFLTDQLSVDGKRYTKQELQGMGYRASYSQDGSALSLEGPNPLLLEKFFGQLLNENLVTMTPTAEHGKKTSAETVLDFGKGLSSDPMLNQPKLKPSKKYDPEDEDAEDLIHGLVNN